MRNSARSVLACAALVLAVSCQGSTDPTEPQAPPTPPATPEPEPTPVYGCGIERGTGLGRNCPRVNPTWDGEVDTAIEKVITDFPWFFNFTRARGSPNSYKVVHPAGYNREVVENLRYMGLCALDDGKEIGVKWTNDFSDHFQILSSDQFIIRGLPSYRSTCYPAWDAIPPHGDE